MIDFQNPEMRGPGYDVIQFKLPIVLVSAQEALTLS